MRLAEDTRKWLRPDRVFGNSFLVSTTLADMLITTLVLPASSAAILAEMENSENLCHFQYGVGSISCLTAAIFTAATGIENFLRLKALRVMEYNRQRTPPQHAGGLPSHMLAPPKQSICTVFQVTILNLIVWLVSGIIVLTHFIFMPHLMYSICGPPGRREMNEQYLLESVTVLGVCLLSFVFLGGLGFLKSVCIMRSWDRPKPYLTSREFAVVTANLWNWFVRFLIWCPSLVWAIVSQFQRAAEYQFQVEHQHVSLYGQPASTELNVVFQRMIVWPAILPPCLSSLINAIANKDFRRCYIQLFHYCCCKTSVALTRRPRDNLRGGSDVRVHIIPGYNMYSSSAGHFSEISAPPTFRGFKCRPLMNCKRDVYEL
ncbi:unnamed protein product [Allacma fusca]|uniref:G-protein coupled receptors family 1 profile domain-containing protein n=1 Tax=Allacma fusca TaxID=39272 RepID=A0A8J2PPP9_9HEXA|nr:unnamed protein product [Allacma fusca]